MLTFLFADLLSIIRKNYLSPQIFTENKRDSSKKRSLSIKLYRIIRLNCPMTMIMTDHLMTPSTKMNNSKTISRPDTFYYRKEGGGGGETEEDNWLETYFSAEIQTLIVIASVTMSHRGERKQCHGIKEQYAARILSHPLLSIYTCGYIATKRSVFWRALIIGHTGIVLRDEFPREE